MRLVIWDAPGHGYQNVPDVVLREETYDQFMMALPEATIAAIHATEQPPEGITMVDVILSVLERPQRSVVLFSGPSSELPTRLAQGLPEVYSARVRCYSAGEFVRRVRQAIRSPVKGEDLLLRPGRKILARVALNALWRFQLLYESGRAKEQSGLDARLAAREHFFVIGGYGGLAPINPFVTEFPDDARMSAGIVQRFMDDLVLNSDVDLWLKRLSAIRELLLDWAAFEDNEE